MKEYTIRVCDIGKTASHPIRQRCSYGDFHNDFPFNPLGRVLPGDVGKICKKINSIWYVENEEQFNRRTQNPYTVQL